MDESNKLATDADVKKLSDGLLAIYSEPLLKVSSSLNELTSKQTTLINSVTELNQRLNSTYNNEVMKAMFADITYCREQLIQIKKQMTSLHERSNKLKARAVNVMNYAKHKQKLKMAELEHEQRLIGGGQQS